MKKDFYFSAKFEANREKWARIDGNEKIPCHSIQGKRFNQQIAVGHQPVGNFDDWEFICQADSEEISYNFRTA